MLTMLRGMLFGLAFLAVLCASARSNADASTAESAASNQPSPAEAATPPEPSGSPSAADAPREIARQKFQEGVRAFEAGHYKDALDALLDADRAMHTPVFSYNIAITYDAMGDVTSALRWYRAYLRELPDAADRVETGKRISFLESQLEKRGLQQVTVLSHPDGATVLVDGNAMGVTPWTGELHPGRHRVSLTLSDHRGIEKIIDLPAHRSQDVSFDLQPTPSSRPITATKEAAPPTRSEGAKVRPLTIVTLGAGGVVLGAALGFELARAAAVDRAREAPQVDYRDELDTARRHQTTARVLAAVGGVLVVGGGVLLFLDLTHSDTAGVEVGCSGSGCFVSKRGVF